MTDVRDLTREYVALRARCSPKQRTFLSQLPRNMFQRWSTAKKIGISPATLARWLRRPHFVAALEALSLAERQNSDISITRIIRQNEAIAFFNSQELYKPDGTRKKVIELDADIACTVTEVDSEGYPIKFEPRRHSLATLERMHNLAPQRHEVTGKDGTPLMPESRPSDDAIALRLLHILERGATAAQSKPPGATPA